MTRSGLNRTGASGALPQPLYGSALRPGAIGMQSIFRAGSLAHPDSTVPATAAAYGAMLERQYAQPVFTAGRGLAHWASSAFTADSIQQASRGLMESFVFQGSTTASPSAKAERLRRLASAPVDAYLVCAQIVLGVEDSGVAQLGARFLTVLQAPTVPPLGEAASSAELWPNVSALSPKMWKPPAEDPLFLLAGSMSHATRNFSNATQLASVRGDYLDELVLTIHGDRLAEVGWIATAAPSTPEVEQYYLPSPPSPASVPFFGPGDAPVPLPQGQHAVLLPLAFPLPRGHGIPAGQLYSPQIGAAAFLAAVRADAVHAADATRDQLRWDRMEPASHALVGSGER